MYKTLLTTVVAVMLAAAPAVAHPPTELEISFDHADSILHLKMRHVSRDLDEHYIRKTIIFKNREEVETIMGHRQVTPSLVEMGIPLTAEPKDKIKVKLYCSDGGITVGTLKIPKKEENEEDK